MHTEEFAGTQEGTLHFHHLLPENGGCVRIASSLEEHVRQLGERLRDPEAAHAETQRFIASFVRPHGLDRPATPIVVDAIERLALTPAPAQQHVPAWAIALRPVVLGVAAFSGAVSRISHPDKRARLVRRARQPVRRLAKESRRAWSMALDRTRRGLKGVKKRARRIPSVTTRAAHAARRGMKQVRHQARQARYHAAVLVKGRVHEDPRA
jgi:hypothetical protein